MLTSSPTISATSSPSTSFHPHSRPYHASRRTSASSSAHSPRFYPQVSAASSRRPDAPQQTSNTATAQSPVVAFTRSPQVRRREYSDAGTQYTPPGYPPTYHPSSPSHANTAHPGRSDGVSSESTRTVAKRRETSAELAVTEPPEPELRIDPQPAVPAQNALGPGGTSGSAETQGASQNVRQNEASTAPQDQPSSAKRARPHDPNVKVMPLKYETCDVKDLGVLISDMLMELVRLNDGIPLRDGQLTRFHSRAPPGISVRDYLFRLIVHATLSPPILLSMVFYVDKLCALYPAFTISSLTVHRFLITAATVAAKGLSDSFWTNSLYARVGGVSVRELALLELEFLRRLEWRIVPKPETLVDYYKGLVERGEGYVMESEPEAVQVSGSSTVQNQEASSSTMETEPPGASASNP
ncbi:cyclin-domain-containing protein [Zopfia rhizophila CBS 207.26]|uniref:Cyclin-domain-containing protein n=1 Tax=Zopfia rhizophila CBS 207.26 TaxID=1314779 RepID=A0A6A6DL02_9PEZI|nr:cyclin-domain-containing protein [Zopfia rhizophila CBS 207.26]